MKHAIASLVALLAVLALAAGPAGAAAYIKIDGIDGEATDKDHQGWIEIESISSRMDLSPRSIAATPASEADGSRRRGSVVLEDVTITKSPDKASPQILEAVCKGKVIPKVDVYLSASDGGSRATYLKYELKNVMVTSYSVHTSGGSDVPVEEFSLNFEEIKVTYDDQAGLRSKGKGGNAETTWKVEKGEK